MLTTVMSWERCYLKEWLAYYLGIGATHVYLMPAPRTVRKADSSGWYAEIHDEKEDALRNMTVDDPRVHVICHVNGQPGSCMLPTAISYQNRSLQTLLMATHLSTRHAGGWLLLCDLDEFLTLPNSEHTSLPDVLGLFAQRGASLIRLPTRSYGANGVKSNPSCEVLGTFPTATEAWCQYNFMWKSIMRAKPGWRAKTEVCIKGDHRKVGVARKGCRQKGIAHQHVESPPDGEYFIANLQNLTEYHRSHKCPPQNYMRPYEIAGCTMWGGARPLLSSTAPLLLLI